MPSVLTFGETELVVDVIELGAAIAAELGAAPDAARLLAAADTRRASTGTPRSAAEQRRIDAWAAPLRAASPPGRWQQAYDTGASLASADCVELVSALSRRPQADDA